MNSLLRLSILCMVICSVACVFFQNQLFRGGPCRLQVTEKQGVCKLLTECPSAVAQVQKQETPQICTFEGDKAIVCCPEISAQKNIRKSVQKCYEYIKGIESLSPEKRAKPKSGAKAVKNEFPHMALLGYGPEDKKRWQCGASLISERYFLTVAHCTYNLPKHVEVRWIKVGLLKRDDIEGVQEYRVEQVIPHPDYKPPSFYNDIALLRTDRTVNFEPNIRPACLYPGEALPGKSFSIFKATATGWGQTEFGGEYSNDLLKVTLEESTHERCNNTYRASASSSQLKNGILPELMLCYGSHIPGADTCQGDSGGPLQVRRDGPCCSYDLIGITSFGKGCGQVPSVYTNISHYVPWIENIVWS